MENAKNKRMDTAGAKAGAALAMSATQSVLSYSIVPVLGLIVLLLILRGQGGF